MTNDFSDFVGRRETVSDTLEPSRSNALRSALGGGEPLASGDPLPLLHHWLYFWDVRPPEGLGVDGHPACGGFLPPVALPRRMWAGGRLCFHRPLLLGERRRGPGHIGRGSATGGRKPPAAGRPSTPNPSGGRTAQK